MIRAAWFLLIENPSKVVRDQISNSSLCSSQVQQLQVQDHSGLVPWNCRTSLEHKLKLEIWSKISGDQPLKTKYHHLRHMWGRRSFTLAHQTCDLELDLKWCEATTGATCMSRNQNITNDNGGEEEGGREVPISSLNSLLRHLPHIHILDASILCLRVQTTTLLWPSACKINMWDWGNAKIRDCKLPHQHVRITTTSS